MPEPNQVKRRYYAIVGLWNLSASAIWGVNTLFLLDAGLSLYQTFVANAFFTAGMVLFEIPTGVVADTRGRRTSFLAALAVLFVGTLWYVGLAHIGAGVVAFSIASVFLGLGFTFYSGAVEAWLVDALNGSGYDGELDPVFARGGQIMGVAMLIGTIGGGLLGQLDLAYPFLVRALLLGALFFVALRFMHDVGFEARPFHAKQVPAEMRRIWNTSIEQGWRDRRVRVLVLIALLQWSFMIWGWYAWQPYFLELLDRDLVWVAGVIAALVSLAMILGNQVAGPLTRLFGKRSSVMAFGITIYALCMAITGLADSFVPAVGAFLLGMVAFGAVGPVQQAAMHRCLPSGVRATVVSFSGMVTSGGSVGTQIGLGRYTQDHGIGSGYVIGAGMAALAVPLTFLLARIGGRADRVGKEPTTSPPHHAAASVTANEGV